MADKSCGNHWHVSASILTESCPTCGGDWKQEDRVFRGLPDDDVPGIHRRATSPSGIFGDEETPDEAFLAELQLKTPWATIVLGVILVAIFLLEVLWGGSQSTSTLWRMGANAGDLVFDGEPWRVLSSAFLHVGFAHLAFNFYALIIFGPFLERLLGARRFLILYGVTAIGAGLASALWTGGLSAGASGAIWGLMGAGAAIAVKPPKEVPEGLKERIGKSFWYPLVINFFYSFQPGIDIYAHLGGGVTGAALVFSGLITKSLYASNRPAASNAPSLRKRELRVSPVQTFAAIAVALLMAASVAAAFGKHRPWELRWPQAPARVSLGETGLSMEVSPTLRMKAPLVREDSAVEFSFGELGRDPVVIGIRVHATNWFWHPESSSAWIAEAAVALETPSFPEYQIGAAPEQRVVAGWPATVATYVHPNGASVRSGVTVRGAHIVRVDVVVPPDTNPLWQKSSEDSWRRWWFPMTSSPDTGSYRMRSRRRLWLAIGS